MIIELWVYTHMSMPVPTPPNTEYHTSERINAVIPSASPDSTRHAGVMINRDVASIATFDRGFDRIEGITRVELT